MLLTEAITMLGAANEQAQKSAVEINAKISALTETVNELVAQLANVELSSDQAAAVQSVVNSIAELDAIVPDAVPVPVEEPPVV